MNTLAQSDTVLLRRMNRADLIPFQSYRNDPEVGRYQSWTPMDDERALGFLQAMETGPLLIAGQWSQIAIVDAMSGLMVGDMGLFLSQDEAEAEIGITLTQGARGKGLATQAMRLAIGLIWTETKANCIRTWCDQRNTASIALMHRLGMTYLGTEHNDVIEEAFTITRPETA